MEDFEPEVMGTPPPVVERGFDRLFNDMAQLNDFIFGKNGVADHLGGLSLEKIREQAKLGSCGPNDLSSIWLGRFIRAMRAELDELEEAVAWKWWKKDKTDLPNAREEIVDLFHFIILAATVTGMDGKDFAKVLYDKRKINFERQTK